jgi:type IV secretion system protein VirB3
MFDPVFKGATRPAMMLGMPVVPAILVVGVHILIAMWMLIAHQLMLVVLIATSCAICIVLMRYITTQDDHRLNQYLLWVKSTALRRNANYWGSGTLSPTEYKKRFD